MVRKLILLMACGLSVACATATSPAISHADAPHHFGEEQLQSVLWMQTSVEYQAVARGAYSGATRALDAAIADPTWNAVVDAPSPSGTQRPAIILDVDETCIDNTAYEAGLLHDHVLHSDARFTAFVRSGQVAAIPGVVDFLKYADSRGVTIFYVTNQEAGLEDATRANLQRLGFPMGHGAEDTFLMVGERPDWTTDKSSRRLFVAQSYRVMMLFGDDLNDFVNASGKSLDERQALYTQNVGLFGSRWFMIPNPSYGSWERAVVGKNGRTPDQMFETKMQALRLIAR